MERKNSKVKKVIRYSEAFKKKVVDEIARGKFTSPYAAQKADGIRGQMTVTKWIRKYGKTRDRFAKGENRPLGVTV